MTQLKASLTPPQLATLTAVHDELVGEYAVRKETVARRAVGWCTLNLSNPSGNDLELSAYK
jgi:hypothetical protein